MDWYAETTFLSLGGMAIAGAGAGINELTALAVTSELAPTRNRGKYVAFLTISILPFTPAVIYGQLVFYFPPPRLLNQGLTRREVLSKIDFVGGALSIPGISLFMMALQWGGHQYAWSSLHVLISLLLGIGLLVVFTIWEVKFAKYPM